MHPSRTNSRIFLSMFISLLALHTAFGQKRNGDFPRQSPNATISQNIGITSVSITYGRPAVKARKIFGELEPYDKVWRAGANEATTISFSTDVTVEGKSLPAGTYGLFMIPGASGWTIIFNKIPNQWGAYTYDEKQDILRVKVEQGTSAHHELLTYAFEDLTLNSGKAVLYWDKVRVPFTIQTETLDLVRAKVKSALDTSSDWKTGYRYGLHALYDEMLLSEALGWTDKSLVLNENFDNLTLKAYLFAASARYADAVQAGEKALAFAKKAPKQPEGVADLEKTVEEWKAKSSAKD